MKADALVLRDIHQPLAPSWWPPAPGWWLLALLALLVLAWWVSRAWRRQRRRRALARLFDGAVARARSPADKVAAISDLLRRAAREVDPAADTLLGEDWLRFLDRGMPEPVFSTGAGQLLRDGAFRPEVPEHALEALRGVARVRFLRWMGAR
jgi:hypothetical protein